MTGSSINIKELLEDAVENVIDTELDELYDRIELLFNRVNDGISITGSPEIIQKNEYADISVRAVRDGVPLDNKTIYFYEIIRPTLSLTSPTNAIQSGDRCDVSVKVKDEDGSIVDGEIVKFYTLVSEHYTYIGSGETDENGVAHLSIDTAGNSLQSNGYLADGDGNIGIVAKYDDEISQPLLVGDCTFYDKGILNDPQTTNWGTLSNVELTRGTEYSTISNTASSGNRSLYLDTNVIPTVPFACEFDIHNLIDSACYLVLGGAYSLNTATYDLTSGDVPKHIKLVVKSDNTTEWYTNGVLKYSYTYTSQDTNRLQVPSGKSMTFSNFKLYQFNSASNVVSSISASATNPIIQSGESSTITARAIGTDGGLVRHQPIKVYNGNTLIGTMTDNKGVHTYSYTGTGRGAIYLKCGNVSQPFPVLDCIQVDDGSNNEFWRTSGLTVNSRDANGTSYTFEGSSGNGYGLLNRLTTSQDGKEYDWNDDYCFEFELLSHSGTVRCQFLTEANTGINLEMGYYNMVDGHTYALKFRKSGTIDLLKDGEVLREGITHEINTWYRFAFMIAPSSTVVFKDFKVYPI